MADKKIKFWKRITLVLLFFNLALVSLMVFKPGHPGPHGPEALVQYLSDELNFSPQQREALVKLDQLHHKKIRVFIEEGGQLRNTFFTGLREDGVTDSVVRQRAQAIANNQLNIEAQTFYHFKAVRGLCNQSQAQQFDKIIFEVLRKMGPHPPKRHE